jgi:cbb3-type cytochrome oxidase subunit 3
MISSVVSLHPYAFAIIASTTLLASLFIVFICIYHYVYRSFNKRKREATITENRLIYSSPASITSKRFVFSLTKLPNTDTIETNIELSPKITRKTLPNFSINDTPMNYKTFDLAKRSRQDLSSDSSATQRRSQPQSFSFGTIKSKFQQVHSISLPVSSQSYENINSEQVSTVSSDSEDIDNELFTSTTPSFEYSLTELFRIELVYKLYYSIEDNQLLFQIIRLTPMQSLIEQYFSSLICKMRLFTTNDKRKTKKYFSKKDPINELFKFDLDQSNLEKSYLKLHLLGHHKNDKRLELGQTVLVINQYNHFMNKSEQYTKSIQIYEDRIDMIIRQQV